MTWLLITVIELGLDRSSMSGSHYAAGSDHSIALLYAQTLAIRLLQ